MTSPDARLRAMTAWSATGPWQHETMSPAERRQQDDVNEAELAKLGAEAQSLATMDGSVQDLHDRIAVLADLVAIARRHSPNRGQIAPGFHGSHVEEGPC